LKKPVTRENWAGIVILAVLFFLIFVLPPLVGEASPELTGVGLAGFIAAHLAAEHSRQRRGSGKPVSLEDSGEKEEPR
jgi:hypothetical protein